MSAACPTAQHPYEATARPPRPQTAQFTAAAEGTATRHRGRTRRTRPRSRLHVQAGAYPAVAEAGVAAPPGRPGSQAPRPSHTRPSRVRDLQPIRWAAVARTQKHDVFLCHAWPDRQTDAKNVHDLLISNNVSVWFSEMTLRPGIDMRVAIDKGLVSSRIGIVLVTPAMLDKLSTDRSIASNELSALLRRNLLVPVMHGVTFEQLDQVSPTLASRGGFSTAEEPIAEIVVKIAELVGILADEEASERNIRT